MKNTKLTHLKIKIATLLTFLIPLISLSLFAKTSSVSLTRGQDYTVSKIHGVAFVYFISLPDPAFPTPPDMTPIRGFSKTIYCQNEFYENGYRSHLVTDNKNAYKIKLVNTQASGKEAKKTLRLKNGKSKKSLNLFGSRFFKRRFARNGKNIIAYKLIERKRSKSSSPEELVGEIIVNLTEEDSRECPYGSFRTFCESEACACYEYFRSHNFCQ